MLNKISCSRTTCDFYYENGCSYGGEAVHITDDGCITYEPKAASVVPRAIQPVTWDMIAEKLDTELEFSKTYMPPDGSDHLLPYFKAAIACIHRCLKRRKIPPDLYDAVYIRRRILGEICHHWMDEAGQRNGDTRDKDGVAEISIHNWLKQVRLEKRETASKTRSIRAIYEKGV